MRKKEIVSTVIPYIIVGLYPFIWFLFTQNHSYEHSMFTCRILSASVFALLCAVGKVSENR
jgi:phosphoglycerol transferase MdoB-like AlkP superfamily enzyme